MLSHAFVSPCPRLSCPPAKLLGHSANPRSGKRHVVSPHSGRTLRVPSLPQIPCLRREGRRSPALRVHTGASSRFCAQ